MATTPNPTIAAIDALFQPFVRSDAPGLVVGVSHRGRLLYRRGFGMASLEHATANTPTTRMRIASVTKHFTCVAALLLAEEGKLDLDAPITAILPEIQSPRGTPNLRQCMTHTSGVRCFTDMLFLIGGLGPHPAGSMLPLQARQGDANFAPGETQLYSNGAYSLLSIAIERAAGCPFEQFMAERLFEPLGMIDTLSAPNDLALIPGMATLHMPTPSGQLIRGISPTLEVRGEGSIVSTVDDMLAWMAHLRSAVAGAPRVGSPAIWQQLVTPAQLANGLVSPYALGLFVDAYRGVDTLHHAGGAMGGAAEMITVPEHELDIIIIANGMMQDVEALARQVIDIVLDGHLAEPVEQQPAADRFPHLHGAQYHSPTTGTRIGFAPVGDRLGLAMFNLPAGPILIDEGTSLRAGFDRIVMGPFVWQLSDLAPGADGGAPTTLPYTDGGRTDVLHLLPVTPPTTAEAGAALVGRYEAPDVGAIATIAFAGEELVCRLIGDFGLQTLTIEAMSDDAFTARPQNRILPFGYGITMRRTDGEVSGFDIGSGRTRQLRFHRIGA